MARILAGIFHDIGLLPEDELVEVGRADLIAAYEGQTAGKVRNVFRRAKGKVLFIDEAYSLLEGYEGEFGDEAINTIVQEMENNREDTVVIFAGYPDRMEEFMARNPGLRSRVPFCIRFRDYSAEEMAQIAEKEAATRGFRITPAAREKLIGICEKATGQANMGNGRLSRNLVESAILNYAYRIYGTQGTNAEVSIDRDFSLREEDFRTPAVLTDMKKSEPIGFRIREHRVACGNSMES